MARPPMPNQRRYRGVIRADMRSAFNHLDSLIKWHGKYTARGCETYPTQLASEADIAILVNAADKLLQFMAAAGPIPIRPGCPQT